MKVSIVIVCMNNLKNLYPCLDSIRKHTAVSYETLVVAYLFSKENLEKVRKDYPWVTIIESNEIRGFSENNNLALRQARGKYCFVVNDDTEMKMPVIDKLVESFSRCPDNTAIVSPVLLNAKGEVAVCGRNKMTWKTIIVREWVRSYVHKSSKFINQKGLFRTYNIIGAAFLIKTELFKKVGWFDERYFFCPEDIALSTQLNDMGYSCYVDADVPIYHYEGMSGKSLSRIQTATKPAEMVGMLIFTSRVKKYRKYLIWLNYLISMPIRFIFHYVKSLTYTKPNMNQVLAMGDKNCIKALFMSKTPKETFIHFYKKI